MDNYMIAFFVFLAIILLSRAIQDKANKKLETDKKAALVDIFSNNKIWNYVILLTLIGVYFLVLKSEIIDVQLAVILYAILLMIFILVVALRSYQKLKSNGFPESYIKTYILTSSLRLVGLVTLIIYSLSLW